MCSKHACVCISHCIVDALARPAQGCHIGHESNCGMRAISKYHPNQAPKENAERSSKRLGSVCRRVSWGHLFGHGRSFVLQVQQNSPQGNPARQGYRAPYRSHRDRRLAPSQRKSKFNQRGQDLYIYIYIYIYVYV